MLSLQRFLLLNQNVVPLPEILPTSFSIRSKGPFQSGQQECSDEEDYIHPFDGGGNCERVTENNGGERKTIQIERCSLIQPPFADKRILETRYTSDVHISNKGDTIKHDGIDNGPANNSLDYAKRGEPIGCQSLILSTRCH